MITQLACPSVCVIDEDPVDFGPILAALNELYVSSIHILGNDITKLPAHPFRSLRLVFVDLHLTSGGRKDTASHTANVFSRVVSPDAAPVIAVIWSKYAGDRLAGEGAPPEDQETEAELFRTTLLDFEPKYRGRVIFVEMEKLKLADRPKEAGAWTNVLKAKIEEALKDQSAVDLLWKWNSLVHEASIDVGCGLTTLAQISAQANNQELKDSLKDAMQRIAEAQGESDFSTATAPRHLSSALAQLLIDHLENLARPDAFAAHGNWLGKKPVGAGVAGLAGHINSLLLTSEVNSDAASLMPGTVYRALDVRKFYRLFGDKVSSLINACCPPKPRSAKWKEWRANAKPVLVEISPECDVAQGNRSTAFLIAGVVVPAAVAGKDIKKEGAFTALPVFRLRHSMPDLAEQDVVLVLCHRFKAALPLSASKDWLCPWFRLRELPTAALRNAHAAQASRVGLVSLRN